MSLARSLTKSNFAPAMMHDARRITDVDVDRVRQRTAISCLARFSRVDEAAFSFSLPLCILGWKPPPRAQFGRSASSLFLPLFDGRERHRFDRKRSRRDGVTDGRKGAIIRNNLPESIPITAVLSFPSAVDHADVNQ